MGLARKWGPTAFALLVLGFIGGVLSNETDQDRAPITQTTTQPLEEQPIGETPSAPSQEPVLQEGELYDNELTTLLAALIVEPESNEPYDRDLFDHWVDEDGDGCDARREVLIEEAIEPPTIGAGCDLIGGLWYSPFDGETSIDDSSFEIDHLVPLSEAWDSGANEWSDFKRRDFANDLDLPQALVAVSASSNRSKGDRDPADWLPPLQSYRCQYVEDWVRVKVKWELSVDEREFSAIRSLLATC